MTGIVNKINLIGDIKLLKEITKLISVFNIQYEYLLNSKYNYDKIPHPSKMIYIRIKIT